MLANCSFSLTVTPRYMHPAVSLSVYDAMAVCASFTMAEDDSCFPAVRCDRDHWVSRMTLHMRPKKKKKKKKKVPNTKMEAYHISVLGKLQYLYPIYEIGATFQTLAPEIWTVQRRF